MKRRTPLLFKSFLSVIFVFSLVFFSSVTASEKKESHPGPTQNDKAAAAMKASDEAERLVSEGSLPSLLNAISKYQEALALCRGIGSLNCEAVTLDNLGRVHERLGEKKKALEYYNQVLPIASAMGDRGGEARTLNNIGHVYSLLGENQKALEYYNQALPIWRSSVVHRGSEATTLSNIGAVYHDLGEKQKALEYYNQALAIKKAVRDRGGEATTLTNIGRVYDTMGKNRKALEYYNRALPIRRAVGDRGGEATTLNNIGLAYDSLGKKQKALEYYNRVLPIRRAVNDRGGEAITLNNIGYVHDSLGKKQKALEYYNRALPVLRAVGNRRVEAVTLNNLSSLWRTSSRPIAIFYGKQAINILQQLRSNISGLEKEVQQTFLRSNEEAYRDLAVILISDGRLPEAQQVLGLLKEEEYFEFVRRDGNEASSLTGRAELTPEEAAQEKRYREIADRLTAIGFEYGQLRGKQSRTTEDNRRLARLESDLTAANQVFQQFLDELEKTFSSYQSGSDKVFQLRESQGLMETLRELGSGAVALYTVVGEEKEAKRPSFKKDPAAPHAHPYYWAPFILIGNWK